MRILTLIEKDSNKKVTQNIVHVNPNLADSDCVAVATAINSLSTNDLIGLKKRDESDLTLPEE